MNLPSQPPAASQPEIERELVAESLKHLDAEQATLTTTLAALRTLREALVCRDIQRLMVAVEQQQEAATQTIVVARARQQLRQRLAPLLRVPPESVTFASLAELFPADARGQLERRRKRLTEMAAEADLLNRANVALARQGMDLLGHVLSSLTGQQFNECYDHSGQVDSAINTPIVEANC